MEYTIEWMERKTTSTQKNKIDCTLKDIQGKMTEGVTIWEGFPNFESLMPGSHVTGDIVPAKDPKYGPTLYPPRTSGPKPIGNISKLMDKKAENIEKAQERKSDSIAYFNSVNSAIALVTKFETFNLMDTTEIRDSLTNWREWFLSEYEKHSQKPPF